MRCAFCTFNKLAVLALLGGFAMLLIEIRYLHQGVLGTFRVAWVPIVYSGVMLVVGIASLALWERGGRRVLFWAFAPALVAGLVGFWFHNTGQPVQGVKRELAAWKQPIVQKGHEGDAAGDSGESEEQGAGGDALTMPPALAPLTFVGLGLLGMLACARRLQPEAAARLPGSVSGS